MTSLTADNLGSTFYVLDFDRCLGNTAKLYAQLERSIEALTPITLDQLRHVRNEVEASGGSFDAATYVQQVLGQARSSVTWESICETMIAASHVQDMLEPGAGELLQLLNEHDQRYGILTYGSEAWQRTKLRAAGLSEIPAIITNHTKKSEEIAEWKQSDGAFLIPATLTLDNQPFLVDAIVLIDDKAVSFKGLPNGVSGYHVVWQDRESLPSQAGELPEGVAQVNGMYELIDLLFSKQ